MNFKPLLLICNILVVGCATQTEYVEVQIPVDRFVAVPAELTQPCIRPTLQPETWADVAILAQEALTALDNCNNQMNAIRDLK